MSVGKRLNTTDPLTEHDVAERITHATLRLIRMLVDVRETDGDLFRDVRHSRYLNGELFPMLTDEVGRWLHPEGDDSGQTATTKGT